MKGEGTVTGQEIGRTEYEYHDIMYEYHIIILYAYGIEKVEVVMFRN